MQNINLAREFIAALHEGRHPDAVAAMLLCSKSPATMACFTGGYKSVRRAGASSINRQAPAVLLADILSGLLEESQARDDASGVAGKV